MDVVVKICVHDPDLYASILFAIVPAADYRRSRQGRNLSNSRRDIGKRRKTSLVGSNDRVGSSEPEPPAGLPAGKRGKERRGDLDRQKVLTYRQVDVRVHSNTSVHDLWWRTHERVNCVFYFILITLRLLILFLKFYQGIFYQGIVAFLIVYFRKEHGNFII